MKLSDRAIIDFKHLYFAKYGITLTDEQAEHKALKLLSFLRRIGYPVNRKSI